MTRIYNLQLYEFWKYAFSSNLGLSQLKFSDFIFNSSAMLASHIMPMVDVAELQSPTDIFYFVSGTLWLILFINIKDRKEFLKWTFVIIMFCLFQSLILSRRSGRLFLGSFYWGHLFSIFYSFIIALSLGTKQVSLKYKKIYKNITRGVLALLIFSAFHNSLLMNNDHMIQNRKGIKVIKNIKSYQTIWPPITNESTAPLSYSDILLIWNERDDFDAALALFNNIPEDGYWMYMHIYMRHNSKVRADGLIWGYPAQ
jgi:hypothetical protein